MRCIPLRLFWPARVTAKDSEPQRSHRSTPGSTAEVTKVRPWGWELGLGAGTVSETRLVAVRSGRRVQEAQGDRGRWQVLHSHFATFCPCRSPHDIVSERLGSRATRGRLKHTDRVARRMPAPFGWAGAAGWQRREASLRRTLERSGRWRHQP